MSRGCAASKSSAASNFRMLVGPRQRLRRLWRDDVGALHRLKDACSCGLGDGSFALVAEGVRDAGDEVLVAGRRYEQFYCTGECLDGTLPRDRNYPAWVPQSPH